MSAEWEFMVALNERLRPLKDPVEIQETVVRLVGEHLHANRVNYSQVDGDEFVITQSYAAGVPPPSSGRAPLGRFGQTILDACRRGETVVVHDAASDPRFGEAERAQLLARQIAASIGVPLIKDGQWRATLGVHSATPRTWTADQIALVEFLAERTWKSGELAHAEEALRHRESRQAFLQRLNAAIGPLADPASILGETCRLVGVHLHANRVSYGEIDGDDCVIVNDYVDGLPSQAGRFKWGSLGGSRTADILKGRTLSVNDTSIDLHTAEERVALEATGIGAYICPLLIKDGRFVAAFGVHSRLPRTWTADEIALVQEVADRTWAVLEHRKAEIELRANEERLSFLLRLNDTLRPLSDANAIQETAARLLAERLGVARAGYAELKRDEYVILNEHARGVAPLVGPTTSMTTGPVIMESLARGETVTVNDVYTDPRLSDDDRATLLAKQIAAYIGLALSKEGRIVAMFGANHPSPRTWTPAEMALVRDVAERTWDAVERTRAETALREQKERLNLALDASAGGSWLWAAATDQVDWDDRFRALYGFTPDEPARSDAWLPRVHEEDRPLMLAQMKEILTSSRDAWQNTFRIVRPDGTIVWIQSRGRAERDADGKLVRLTGLDLDFSEHRRVEEALQERRDQEHAQALETLLETSPQGVVSIDAAGVIISANRAVEEMFGWSPGELIGERIERLVPASIREGHVRHRADYFAMPHARRMGGLPLYGERRDGSTFPIEVTLNHVETPAGARAFAFVTDITERQRAATALQERTAELEHRTTQLSRMASELMLAEQHAREQIARTLHDGLQQLLVIAALNLDQHVKRETEAALAPSELLAEAKRHLGEAIVAARSLSLELFPPVLQRAGLPAALAWLAKWTHEKYNLQVHLVADRRADTARKDIQSLLFESVRELLFNAVKHARVDRVSLELTLDADERLCITLNDQGVGFDPEKLDGRAKAGDLGWGLFSIRERITLLGGRVDVDSAPGRGTRVRLVAPRGSAPLSVTDGHAPAPGPAELVSSAASHGSPPDALRILIAEDHAAVRTALRDLLHTRPQLSVVGYAADGFEAIAHARALRPDVILMDVAMPNMDGIEATARIRAELPDIQVFAFSMQARGDTAHAIEQAGAAAFFVKGVDTQRLIDHLLAFHMARAGNAVTGP
jgi:PAS domain S-box-containing protein